MQEVRDRLGLMHEARIIRLMQEARDRLLLNAGEHRDWG